MDIVLWLVIIVLFIISFVGLVYPIIPSVVLIWGGVAIYYFFILPEAVSWWTWSTFILLTTLLFITDYLANIFFVKRYGGSKWGLRAATIGVIIGCFVIPPFGILIVPFVLVLVTELIQKKTIGESIKVATGTLIAFLSGTFAKAMIQSVMIIVFLLDIFL
ncbi:DUF456 domain-containing protein [Anaerobacillus alkaliphilus]|uniref:DUF456 domain-containing protein n=1 Tax=Anaerobacillus alkaliphilus TaxID=1548597 RepID=A0A4Q0VUB0_9BACI|nr:DUF456 domain-containing protein [Anaerobacillus alkaliphilus]RXJ01923.1 DUF456 domain-containing protein [Anaerobacillus alkaliphilus]